MRSSLGVCLAVWMVGCAHSAGKPAEPAAQDGRALELRSQAEKSYDALNFPACASQFRQAAEANTDADSRSESFYSAARCAALANDAAQGIELLKLAIQSGYYDADTLQYDMELASLHSAAGWQEVMASAKANLAKAPNPPLPVGVLSGFDVYGSRRADTEGVRKLLGFELGKPLVRSKVIFRQKEEALRKQYNLAYANLSYIYFFASEKAGIAYLTVDLVDAEDSQRLRFLPDPSGHPEDPEGLVAQWREYDAKAEHLIQKGMMDMEKGSVCRVPHCTYGFGHPDLAAYEPIFMEKVPKAQDALMKVLREEADPEKRAAAAELLAYTSTLDQAVERLVPFIRDPEGGVRNNVLRVLIADQEAADHPLMEVATVVDALSLPQTTDRNKALYLLTMLLPDLKPEVLKAQRPVLIRQIGAQLVALTAMQQPINRDPAIEVLTLLSGETYETSEQWKAWLARQPQ
ncbi:MAG TPA: HEAT repeat domain-containing protein [Hyalangium sp.]|nr:HEAT repeat domain-containing protein [Hyalangium sp.]